MYYKKFEEIKVWQDSRKFVNDIYSAIRNSPLIRKDFSLTDQLKRSAYSILLNIAEGFERRSNKEFANYLNISKGSAGEVRSILYVMKDNYELPENTFEQLRSEVEAISAQLFNLRKYLIS